MNEKQLEYICETIGAEKLVQHIPTIAERSKIINSKEHNVADNLFNLQRRIQGKAGLLLRLINEYSQEPTAEELTQYPWTLLRDDLEMSKVIPEQDNDHYTLAIDDADPEFTKAFTDKAENQQAYLDKHFGKYSWGLAGYFQRREFIVGSFPQMRQEERFYHLGADVNAPLHTPVLAPLDSYVYASGYEEGLGNYGGFVVLKTVEDLRLPLYTLFGHLNPDTIVAKDKTVSAGDEIGTMTDFDKNGQWFHHTHLQTVTQRGVDEGWLARGYCSKEQMDSMKDLCPNPEYLLSNTK